MEKKAIVCILDGWGIGPEGPGNAITEAQPHAFNHLIASYPNSVLEASGPSVGLPEGQDGNSETGHLNIGAGRVVYQDLAEINNSIRDGSFFSSKVLLDTVRHIKSYGSRLHLLGMIGASGVHSFNDHLFALLDFAKKQNVHEVFLHLITDGRDSPPDDSPNQFQKVIDKISQLQLGSVSTIIGRYYAMDRDLRLDRTQKAFDCLTKKTLRSSEDSISYIKSSYRKNIYDEFIEPSAIGKNPTETRIKSSDAVVFFNFRTDRARQLTEAFSKSGIPNLRFVTMTRYRKDFKNPVIYESKHVRNTIGEVFETLSLKQLRASETEKIAMVTYYFNGQKELPFVGEERLFVDSPKVATYDLVPAMSTKELTKKFCEEFESNNFSLGVINIACPDMVAHTGKIKETKLAINAADQAISELMSCAKKSGAYLVITADHGNAEELLDQETGAVNTEHSTSRVPFIIYHHEDHHFKLKDGKLGDVAPTILKLLDIEKPSEMTGISLVL